MDWNDLIVGNHIDTTWLGFQHVAGVVTEITRHGFVLHPDDGGSDLYFTDYEMYSGCVQVIELGENDDNGQ